MALPCPEERPQPTAVGLSRNRTRSPEVALSQQLRKAHAQLGQELVEVDREAINWPGADQCFSRGLLQRHRAERPSGSHFSAHQIGRARSGWPASSTEAKRPG